MAVVIGDLRAILGLDSSSFQTGLAQARASLRSVGQDMRRVGATMSAAVTAPLGAFGALTVKTAGGFEASMNRVQAATGATTAEFAALRQAARDMGATTQFTASESADAIEVLAKNGLNASQILGGALEASMLLAASAGTDLASAGDIATDVMLQFGKQAGDLEGLVDGINGVLLQSKFGIDDYRLALGQAGGVAGGIGVSFEDFNAAIAGTSSLFASGSDAGTSFKTFLQRLVPSSTPAAEMMEKLNIQFFDAQGNMKSMAEVAQVLQDSMAGLSEEDRNDALTTIFGTDAMRTAIGLMNQGAAGIDGLKRKIADTSAEEQAAARMKGFNGEMLKLRSAFESLQLAIADSGLLSFVTDLVKRLTEFVTRLADTNPEMLKWGVIIAAVAAVLGPLIIGLGMVVAAAGPIMAALGAVAAAAAALGAPFLAAAAVLAGVATAIITNWDTVGPWFNKLFTSIGDVFMGMAKTLAGIVTGDMPLMVEGLKQAWSGLQTYFETLWNGVVAVFDAAWKKIEPIVEKVEKLADRLVGTRDGPISSGGDDGRATGPIIPGTDTYLGPSGELTNGLAAGTAGMYDQGVADGGAYDQGFRDRMGIQSPSRVMMEAGQFVAQGLGDGMLGGQGLVDAATDRVAGSMSDRMGSAIGSIVRNARSLDDVWDRIKGGFANMLSDMSAKLMQSGLQSLLGALLPASLLGAIDPLAGALRGAGLPAVPAFASGVSHFGGGWARINELGGELVKLPSGSTVVPSGLSERMMDRGGVSDQVVQVDITASFDEEGTSIVKRVTQNQVRKAAPQIVGQSVSATRSAMNESKAGWGI